MDSEKKRTQGRRIILMSGSTGRTVEEVVRAALAQFEDPDVEIDRRTHVRSIKAARRIVEEAAKSQAIVFHSLVAPKVRDAVVQHTRLHRVTHVDVLGPVVSALSDFLCVAPRQQPGLSYQLHKEHFERIEAVNFTLAHDDGCALDGLSQADVVLVGPSRVAKSVTCFYLASRGVRAANVPLVPGWELPGQLTSLDKRKVVGLTMNPARLQSIRHQRVQALEQGSLDRYDDLDSIRHELRESHRTMAKHGWQSIDVSYKSVEEVAREILVMLEACEKP
jgi:[pyruvate, water dikinase]-phosphate phosphotransferase / [pyruvate, water dikinase] kinase